MYVESFRFRWESGYAQKFSGCFIGNGWEIGEIGILTKSLAFSGLCEEFGATLNTPVLYNDAGNVMIFNKFSYSAMWIEIRKLDEKGVYYRPLYRQWVMQAICEGLAFSFLLIFVLSIFVLFFVEVWIYLYVCSLILAFIAFCASCYEGRRYAENQIKEVIISYYCLKNQKQ